MSLSQSLADVPALPPGDLEEDAPDASAPPPVQGTVTVKLGVEEVRVDADAYMAELRQEARSRIDRSVSCRGRPPFSLLPSLLLDFPKFCCFSSIKPSQLSPAKPWPIPVNLIGPLGHLVSHLPLPNPPLVQN